MKKKTSKYYKIDDTEISHSKTVRRKGERIAKKKERRQAKEEIEREITGNRKDGDNV